MYFMYMYMCHDLISLRMRAIEGPGTRLNLVKGRHICMVFDDPVPHNTFFQADKKNG